MRLRLSSAVLSGFFVLAGCSTSPVPPPQDDADYIAKTNALFAPPAEFEAAFRTALEDPDFMAAAKKIADAKKAGVAVQKARLLQKVDAVYPQWKLTTRTEFRTFASLLVDANGRVVKTKLVPMKGWEPARIFRRRSRPPLKNGDMPPPPSAAKTPRV